MPSCRNCGAYTKYNNGLCKRCYYARNQRQGGSFFGSVFEGQTGDAIERTPLSVVAIILLLLFGFIFFLEPNGTATGKLTGILMIGLGSFWIYKKIQKGKQKRTH